MKKVEFLFLLVSLSILLMSMRSSGHECITGDGCFRGKKLAGKVRVVDVGEDFKVRVVTVGEDLKVRVDECASSSSEVGRWRFVTVGEDFRIRFVTVGEDFKIRFDDVSNGVSRPCR